jgi:hypothetical protein
LGEAHPLASHSIDIRSLIKAAPITAHVSPAEIVDQNEDDAGPTGRGNSGRQSCEGKKQQSQQSQQTPQYWIKIWPHAV